MSADVQPIPTPEERALQKVRDDGGWIPVPAETVRKLVQRLVSAGEKLDRETAILDALYWADKGRVHASDYYAKRWGWSKTTAWRLLKELGLTRNANETTVKRKRNADETESGDSGKESAKSETAMKRKRNADETPMKRCIQTARPPDPEEREVDARTRVHGGDDPPEGWTAETIPILRAWTTWHGSAEIPPPFQAVIRQLMMPAGGMVGARHRDGTKLHNGYTPADIVRGIEAAALRSHRSPASLVGHVIGDIKPRRESNGTVTTRAGATVRKKYRTTEEFIEDVTAEIEEGRRDSEAAEAAADTGGGN